MRVYSTCSAVFSICFPPDTTEYLKSSHLYTAILRSMKVAFFISKNKISRRNRMYIEMNPTGLTLSDLICVAHRKQSEYTCFANVKDNVFHYRLRLAAERATMAKTCFLDREHRARFQKALHRVRGNDKSLIAQLFVLTATESLWSASEETIRKIRTV